MNPQHAAQSKTAKSAQLNTQAPAAQTPATQSHPVLHLQRQVGNQATAQIIQAKLTVGEPNDMYEQEADRVAVEVVRKLHAPTQSTAQRQPQANPTPQIQPLVQRKADVGGMAVSADIENSIQQARGSGQPLPEGVRNPMEQAFGADFSGVRVHTGGESDRLNRSVQAEAFTTGQNIFFSQGAYDPDSQIGQELLAHELTHVVQQNGGAMQRSPLPPRDSIIQRMFDKDSSTPLLDLTTLNTALFNLSPQITGISLSMLGTDGANLSMLNVAINQNLASLYDSMKRGDVLNLLQPDLALIVNTHAPLYTYDTHGDKHFPGGSPGTKFTASAAIVNPQIQGLIGAVAGRIRRHARGVTTSYYYTIAAGTHGINQCGNQDLTIQLTFIPNQDEINYHAYPDAYGNLQVTPSILSITKHGQAIPL